MLCFCGWRESIVASRHAVAVLADTSVWTVRVVRFLASVFWLVVGIRFFFIRMWCFGWTLECGVVDGR